MTVPTRASAGAAPTIDHHVTMPQLVVRQAQRYPDRDLVVDPLERYTFRGFVEEMMVLARATAAFGVVPGDHVAIWAPNSAQWLLTAMGASAAGAVIVPMNTRFKGREAWDVIRRVRPRLVFTTLTFLGVDYPAMVRAAADGPVDTRFVVLDAGPAGDVDAGSGDVGLPDFRAAARLRSTADAERVRDAVSPTAPSDIILTSGTTGSPKGVLTSHEQNVLGWMRYGRHLGLDDGERTNASLPFFHNFGLKAGFLNSVLLGGACICDSTFDPVQLARLIERERITYLPGTPTLFTSFLGDRAHLRADLSSLRHCLIAGSTVPVDLVARVQRELGVEVFCGYGLSELAGGISLSPPGDEPERVAGWAGTLVEGVEVRVVDELGAEVALGTAGEILARSECVMLGYLDDAASSAAVVDADGWLHTGDIGLVDDESYVKIVDRKKELFIVGGFNAYPAEIEKLLLEHPDLLAAAVVGMPDVRLGEVGAAFVVPRPGVDVSPADVIAWARENMANYKVPRRVVVVADLPLNSSLKVVKDELRARLAATAPE